jgi:ribose-phosphate pyrophosphokinase
MIKINGIELEIETFPNGESHIKGSKIISMLGELRLKRVDITFRYENDGDLIKLSFIKSFIDSILVKNAVSMAVNLTIAYMPYSRMDRVMGDSLFTLKYVAKMINDMKFNKVTIHEAHSDVALALIDNSESYLSTPILLPMVMKEINFDKEKDFVFYPDAGAQKRYTQMDEFKHGVGNKKRNINGDGSIESLEINLASEITVGKSRAIIVDDLSSYGGTFIRSATALKEVGFDEIYLLVGHCEESILKGDIFKTDLINKVYTTNSIIQESNEERLTICPIF